MSSAKTAPGLDLADTPAPIGVYVHFPWCLRKCPYCDFLSVAAERSTLPHDGYADVVLSELERRASELGARRLSSVFFGGGTPSLWEPRELGRVLERITALYPGDAPEITVECNPTSFDVERGKALLDAGVNRVSIGVQSLDQSRLEFLGRLHDVAGGLSAVRQALAAGVPRVSADLIFGVHGQSSAAAVSEALRVAELGVTHLSVYALTIEPGTEFGALARKGRLPILSDDTVAESFLALDAALAKVGFEHYEISNYARDGARSEHNLGYWRGREYLGLGCGAWGTVDVGGERVRYRNTPSPERYLRGDWDAADLGHTGPGELVSVVEPIDGETALRERIMLGLRLGEGIDLDVLARETGTQPWTAERERALERLVARGRVIRDRSRLKIPRDHWLFADGTIAELF